MDTFSIELDDMAIPVAVASYDAEYQPAEPDVGIMHGGFAVTSIEIEDWHIGGLHLSRAHLVQAIGEDAVSKLEEDASDKIVAELEAENSTQDDYGDYLRDLHLDRIAAE